MLDRSERRAFACAATTFAALAAMLVAPAPASAQSGAPIKIGYSMALTGGLAPNGKSALLAQKIWEQDVNAKGGLLDRPVKLVYYDDKSSPAEVPTLYTKLLDVDKVDLLLGAYATAQLAPAMPIVIARKKLLIGLLGLAVNDEFNYPNYFAMIPSGPVPKPAFTKDFFALALAQSPKPQTVAIVAADQEFSKNASDGARETAQSSSRSSTTRPIRPRPPISARSCAPSRRPIRTSWWCAPIRPTRSASCAPSTRSGSSPR
jgi:branched-chain amino acid transport system substrate-binding protein